MKKQDVLKLFKERISQLDDEDRTILGIDEVGKRAIAGPVTVAGCIFKNSIKEDPRFQQIKDSKKLTEKKRENLYDFIINNSIFHITERSNKVIDNIGIRKSILDSEREIMEKIGDRVNFILLDGHGRFIENNIFRIPYGDDIIKEISAASIIAKVTRDRQMREYGKKYPNYFFEKNKGYPTKQHKEAIRKYGTIFIHRKSFRINN